MELIETSDGSVAVQAYRKDKLDYVGLEPEDLETALSDPILKARADWPVAYPGGHAQRAGELLADGYHAEVTLNRAVRLMSAGHGGRSWPRQ